MSVEVFGTKQTAEAFYLQFDFTADIPAGNTIASTTIVCIKDSTEEDTTAAMIDPTKENVNGLLVNAWFFGGQDNEYYTITCRVKTAAEEVYELDGRIYIQDLPAASAVTTQSLAWDKKKETAQKMINKYGADMTLTHVTKSSYNVVTDKYATSEIDYPARGLLLNPTIQNDLGEYSKSDRVQIILAAKGIPDLTNADDWKITCGTETWWPERIVPIRPGGVAIIYLVYLK